LCEPSRRGCPFFGMTMVAMGKDRRYNKFPNI